MSPLARPPERSANIFINYRREDSAGHAGRLFDGLSSHFPGRLFMDVDTIAPGVDFGDAIEQAVGSCEVLIVVIGREWLTIKNAAGHRRLDDPGDFVRLELEAALARNIRVIPVLVQDAPMPRAEELPSSLARLARRNAIELSDARWAYDLDRLAHTIQGVLREESSALPSEDPRETATNTPQGRPARPWALPRAAMFLLAALLLVSAAWISKDRFLSPTGETTASRVDPTPVPAPSSPAPAEQYADVEPVAPPSPTRLESNAIPDRTAHLPEITITSPKDGDKAGECFTASGSLSELGTGQRAFLGMRNRKGTTYPRKELLPSADGQWSLEAESSHDDFEIFVLLSTNLEAGATLSDPSTQRHGLRLPLRGASITGPIVSLKTGKYLRVVGQKCSKTGR